ncbi:AraC family transcriptional regulator [Paenibacillus sp. IHBB 10380]|uniref:AraC family transcriptional regulator n=1 Tax=Paenibacillus sp. IHBB 10380 TaxID=1566358 RepID=UPI0005CFCFE3|nr:AraC family transcriptional regulator [Paenibacillus sp. IHBB 10380]AJS58750.1 AraC family transcriptional regulator [Paenibacillus sp. IHBB 10380]
MKLEEHIMLWNHTAVKILDIRHVIMNPGELLDAYLLPASSFIYGVRGSASLHLDSTRHEARQFHVLHGGKGMRLDIEAKEEFEYYLLFYRAVYAFPVRKELVRLMEQHNPFTLQYAFRPEEPVPLLRYLILMEKIWEGAKSLDRLHIKGLFYQFIHELLRQLETQGIRTRKPDLVSQAIRYIDAYYQESLTLELIADKLNYSPRHLSMRFKEQTGASPIHYLIQVRVNHAIELLLGTDATLQEIAHAVGYSDVYYFSRIFKKNIGLSPIRFQKAERQRRLSEDHPFKMTGLSIGTGGIGRYIDNGDDNHYQYKHGGSIRMRINSKSGLAVSLLLSITLLLGACSTGGTNSGTANGGATPSSGNASVTMASEQNTKGTAHESNQASEAQTRIVSTEMGDVEIPANPKRVVVLYLLGDLVAMGIKPVGVSDVFEGAAFEKELEGVEMLGTWFEPNPEAVMSLNPDLIIVPSLETYNKLKQIAPTVYVPYEKMTTEERLTLLSKTFGKEQEVQTLLANFNKKVEESKEKLAAAGLTDKTVTIIEGSKKEMFVIMNKQYGRGSQIIYEYLGMKAPEIVQKKMDVATEASSGYSVSMEVLSDYIGDYVFRSSYKGMDDLTGNAIWNSIPAIKENRLIEISFNLFYYNDIYSIDKQLDFIMENLLASAPKN